MKVIILMYLLLLGHMTLCRDVFHVIGAPTRCLQGYKQDYSGRCRKVFFWKHAWSRVSSKIDFEIQGHVGLRVEKAYCCLTFWHRSFIFNSNNSPTWCNNFSIYYPDFFLQLIMFRAFSRPSSGAHWLQWQSLVSPSYRGDSRAVFVVGPAGRPARPRTHHDYHHET
jgi:hypothetical protein